MSLLLLRAVCLYLPISISILLWFFFKPNPRQRTSILLAVVFLFPTLLIHHLLAAEFSWWKYTVDDVALYDFPVDLYLSWIVLWGVMAPLLIQKIPSGLVFVLLVILDLVFMPMLSPLVVLHEDWLIGEVVGFVFILLPMLVLIEITAKKKRLAWRVALQFFIFTSLLLWFLPSVIFEFTNGSWQSFLQRPYWQKSLGLSVLVLFPGLLGLKAVLEFYERGQGTPLPYDPPQKLVQSGPYAFLRNPMQVSMTLILLLWGVLLESYWVSAGSLISLFYSIAVANFDEEQKFVECFGQSWQDYKRRVHLWFPQWVSPVYKEKMVAKLYVDKSCDLCSQLGRWFEKRKAQGLLIVAAEQHPTKKITRLTYESVDGDFSVSGLKAVARGLEHIHLGWAWLGWGIALPIVNVVLQWIVDLYGGEPRELECK